MNRLVPFLLMAWLATCAGCFTAALPDHVTPKASSHVSQSLPVVTAGYITPSNAADRAQALEEELSREEQEILFKAKTP